MATIKTMIRTQSELARKPKPVPKKIANRMTEEEVIDLIKEAQGEKTLREFGDEIGVTAAYISDVYNGRRSPGAKILTPFGIGKSIVRRVEYIFFKR